MAEPAVFGTELRDGRLTVRVPEFAGFTRIVARVARDAGVRLFEVAPTDDSLESVFEYLVSRPVTIFGDDRHRSRCAALLGRRRTLLMLLLAGDADPARPPRPRQRRRSGLHILGQTLDGLVIRTVLPLVALVFGTAALGSELEDGTGVHFLTKPIAAG